MSAQLKLSVVRHAFPGRGLIVDLAGMLVDTDTPVWKLNDPTKSHVLHWSALPITSASLLAATTAFISELIKFRSPSDVDNHFKMLSHLRSSPEFLANDAADVDVSYKAMSEVVEALGCGRYRGHYLRQWYRWCCDHGYPNFSEEVAFRLSQMSFGKNARASAVLSSDPTEGPLTDLEFTAFINALRGSRETGSLDVAERAALWLCVALGLNPMQFALLREEDCEALADPDGNDVLCILNVPRHKKRDPNVRSAFKPRKLTSEIAGFVKDLIAHNSLLREVADYSEEGMARPLFRRPRPREPRVGGEMHEFALGITSNEFTSLVSGATRKLGVISPRTGAPLHITCRRFRYTLATRLVREGASQRQVAELLDHSDLQSVQCYFDLKSDIVESLDKATTMTLAPVAQAFLGHLVRSEADANRGDNPSSRIYAKRAGEIAPVGTCGSMSFCGLYAPIACYTCVKFQPWVEAPHEEVLEALLAERTRRQDQGLDARMVGINDNTILAVADVVGRIAAMDAEVTIHVS